MKSTIFPIVYEAKNQDLKILDSDLSSNDYSQKVLIIKTRFDFMPLGIGYVLSSLEKNNIPFDFWDMLRPSKPESEYLENIKSGNYFLIGTGGFVFNIHDFIEITEKCKSANINVPIILGGNITRNLSVEKLLEYLNVDYVYIGESEASFVDFVKALYTNKKDFSGISGIGYFDKEKNEIIKSGQVRVDLAANHLMPAYHLLDVEHYISTNKHIRFHKLGKVMAMLTGRGCTGGCSFCSPTVGKFVAPEITNTISEIKYLYDRYKFDALNFITEIFFQHPHEVLQFCAAYKELNINKPWFCCVSPHMSPEVYPAMKDAGCVGFNMGLESGSDRILAKTKIGCTVANFEKNYHEARKNGLFVDVSYMVLNENETEEDVRATFDTLIRNRMQQESFGLVSAYPGTSIYAKAFKKGRIKNELAYIKSVMSGRYWKTYNIAEFEYLNISAIPDDQIYNVVMREVRRYYSFLRVEFQAKEQSFKKIKNDLGLNISGHYIGKCCECNSPIEKIFDLALVDGIFEHTQICGVCFSRNFFDFTNIDEYRNHFNDLKKKISAAKRIIIIGRGKIAEDTLFYDCLKLDASKILCVIDERSLEEEMRGIEEHSDSQKKYFYNLPRLRKENIKEIDYDLALIADLLPNMLNAFYPNRMDSRIHYINPITSDLAKKYKNMCGNKFSINTQNIFQLEGFLVKILSKNAKVKNFAKHVKKYFEYSKRI